MKYHLTEGRLNCPAEASAVDGLSTPLGVALPESYIEFLRAHDGGEGFIGDNYVIFWKAEEVVDFNREYEVETYAPGIFLFASNGGGEAYGFDALDAEMPISYSVYRHGSSACHLGSERPSRSVCSIGRRK